MIPIVEIVLLTLLIAMPLLVSDFLTIIITRMVILAMLAISFDLCWGYSGIMTFGQALFFGMSGYVVALLANKAASCSSGASCRSACSSGSASRS